MSTYIDLNVCGTAIEAYRNHHNTWFFKRSDRVRENCPAEGEYDYFPDDAFVGYRASAATIRRRMVLDGYDIDACRDHFNENLKIVTALVQESLDSWNIMLQQTDSDPDVLQRVNGFAKANSSFLAATQGTTLDDWIACFPSAAELEKNFVPPLEETYWLNHSSTPLVNAMLSSPSMYAEFSYTDRFNFPCINNHFFHFAFLSACPDDAVCELNIAPLIDSGYEEDFRDLEEIQQQETRPHQYSRESIEETVILSATQPENLSLQRMCYASIITAMEAYLGDILKREIFDRQTVKERFVASYKPFREQSFPLTNLYKALSAIDAEIKKALDTLSLHNIGPARSLFRSTLLTEFSEESLRVIGAAVKLRHDIIHRNGRDTKGDMLSVERRDVVELSKEVLCFTHNVDAQILDGLLHEHSTGGDGG